MREVFRVDTERTRPSALLRDATVGLVGKFSRANSPKYRDAAASYTRAASSALENLPKFIRRRHTRMLARKLPLLLMKHTPLNGALLLCKRVLAL